jgi:hypothetical protein
MLPVSPKGAVFLALLVLNVSPAAAATIRVPADQPTIQQAIDAASAGDEIVVAPGTYAERLDFKGKNITLRSDQGPELTIIDAGGAGSVVTFKSGETRSALLSGFTISGGRNTAAGAGIEVAFSSPTIRGNVITDNRGCTGVGIHSYFSSPRIEGNTITGNAIEGCTGAWGIGIYIGGNSTAEIIGNEISNNVGGAATGGGVALFAAGRATVIGNIIAGNTTTGVGGCGWGGAIATANFVEAAIVNNLIVGNRACYGGAFHWRGGSGATVLANNTIADNEASVSWSGIYATFVGSHNQLVNNIVQVPNGPALFCDNSPSTPSPTLDSNDLFSGGGAAYGGTCADQTGINGNISADAEFLSAATGDYRVGDGSPVVDAGNNAAPHIQPTDLDGNPRIASASGSPDRIDMGAYELFTINTAPTVDAGPNQTVAAGADCLASVTLAGSGFDPDGDSLTFTWTSSIGTLTGPTAFILLPAGTYTFTLTATDGRGGSASASMTVTVLDVTPPSISAVTATPNVIVAAGHDMRPVVVSVDVSDACGAEVTCRIVSVASDEPQTGLGGGDIGPDWEITGSLTLNLRAERWNKGDGRVYTITVRCSDAAGNQSTSFVVVTVPRR